MNRRFRFAIAEVKQFDLGLHLSHQPQEISRLVNIFTYLDVDSPTSVHTNNPTPET
jgi:hypothetical protein